MAGAHAERVRCMIELRQGDYRLAVAPERGGSIFHFYWRGLQVMRSACGRGILDVASFPLVPFSNRIAFGEFASGGKQVKLCPNMPGSDHPHPLHGFGWQMPCEIVEQTQHRLLIRHFHRAREWPWDYFAEQLFELAESGLKCNLSLLNVSPEAMPVGLGFHPYFPRTPQTQYLGLHRGEWTTSTDGLPEFLDERAIATDWWNGQHFGSRSIDTVYSGREEPLEIVRPDCHLALTITPSDNLPCTVLYTPEGADFSAWSLSATRLMQSIAGTRRMQCTGCNLTKKCR